MPKPTVTLTQLPLEVLFHVFLQCDVDSLGVLSICSTFMRDRVAGFLAWAPAVKALSFNRMQQKDAIKHCKSLGVLMKRVTCLFPTKDRLRIMLRFIERFVSRPALVRSRLPRDVDATCRQWHQYGAFLMAAVVGWVDSECQLVYEVLAGLSSAHRFTARVLGARPGHLRREELALRHFIRCLFLSEVRNEDSCAWLFRLLQPWPLVFRAKLIFIIYGPCCHLMSREWLPVNRAMLLAHCGSDICVQMLASKLVNGRKAEVASILYNLILVQTAVPQSARFVIDVARALHDVVGQMRFLKEIPLHSSTLLRGSLRYYANGEEGYEQVCHSLLSFVSSMLELSCVSESNCGRLFDDD